MQDCDRALAHNFNQTENLPELRFQVVAVCAMIFLMSD
jgi:hypothetical protein